MPKEETQPIAVQKQQAYEYTVTYAPRIEAKGKIRFTTKEISHLAVAAVLVTCVGLSLAGIQRFIGDYTMLTLSIIAFVASFLAHEIAHKVAAQKVGLWAEFRLTLIGAVLTLLSIVSPIFKVISPGAVMISGYADARSIGKIALTGPVTNIALSTTFLVVTFLFPQNTLIALVFLGVAAFNAWIALFNLIPFGMFDGFKVFLWDKRIWVLAFGVSLVLTASSYAIS